MSTIIDGTWNAAQVEEDEEFISHYVQARTPRYAPETTKTISSIVPCSADPEMFFSTRDADIKASIEICNKCIIAAECRKAAIDMDIDFGVWGGQNFNKKAGK